MFKRTTLAIALALPLIALAGTPSPKAARAAEKGAAPASAAASASARAARQRAEQHAELHRVQARGTTMGACTKQAADQKLGGIERKQFIAKCIHAQ